MNLRTILQEPIFSNLIDSQCVDKLNEEVVLSVDNTLYTVRQLRIAVGDNLDELRLVLGTIDDAAQVDPLVKAFNATLNSTGINFADTLTQVMIDTLAVAGSWSDDLKRRVKEIGVVVGKRWQKYGLSELPTEEEISSAKQANLNAAQVTALLNEVINPMVSAGNTVNEIKAAVAAWE